MDTEENIASMQSSTDKVRLETEKHKRQLFHRHMLGSTLGSTLIVIIMALMFWHKQESNVNLYLWLVCIMFFIFFRLFQGLRFSNSRIDSPQAKIWGKLIHIYTIGAGLTWGLSPYIFKPSTTHELIFTALYACGLIAAATVSLSARMKDFMFFTGSIAMCMVSYHFVVDYPYSNLTGLLFFIYFTIAAFFARNVKLLQSSSSDLIEKNILLIDKLTLEKENVERSSKEKTRFIANASHDLRQPLHALGLYLDSLSGDRSAEDKQQILSKSKRSLKSLDDLFSSLLDISNIDAGVVTISPLHFRVEQLFQQIMDHLKGGASEKNINIDVHVSTDDIVFCDPLLTARCLRNVVINAIKHADCSLIKIECTVLEDMVEVSVSDNGKGIQEDSLDIIFEEFHQLDNPNRDRQKGLGLGLSIVKKLFELQGHAYEIQSTVGSGTKFSFLLPRGNGQFISNILYRERESNEIDFNKSILIVDDEQQVLDSMGMVLKDWQQDIMLAGSIDEANKVIDEGFVPDIIFTDYRLQNNQTGADVISKVKDKLPDHTQVIFITGETEPSKIIEIRAHGKRF